MLSRSRFRLLSMDKMTLVSVTFCCSWDNSYNTQMIGHQVLPVATESEKLPFLDIEEMGTPRLTMSWVLKVVSPQDYSQDGNGDRKVFMSILIKHLCHHANSRK